MSTKQRCCTKFMLNMHIPNKVNMLCSHFIKKYYILLVVNLLSWKFRNLCMKFMYVRKRRAIYIFKSHSFSQVMQCSLSPPPSRTKKRYIKENFKLITKNNICIFLFQHKTQLLGGGGDTGVACIVQKLFLLVLKNLHEISSHFFLNIP